MIKKTSLFLILFCFVLSTAFTASPIDIYPADHLLQSDDGDEEPVLITGSFEYSNDFVVETYYVEHAVGLLDMTGFVLRDKEWELPVEGQVLGFMDLDEENNRATYRLSLPAMPSGEFNDVDNDGNIEKGLQIFVVAYNPNLSGGVFSEGDDRSMGWPGYLASIRTDRENQDELMGGKLVIWAADGNQAFPSGWGDDGMLFTADDPVAAVPAGYSIVDLDSDPFTFSREQNPELTLYEPDDIKVKDFSDQTYVEAFGSMFEIIRQEYAFNGVPGKQPDWDVLYGELAPRVAQAESAGDPYEFFLALRELALAFQDGHVSFDGGEYERLYNENNILGGWGFSVQELEDERVITVYVLEDGPADKAGMRAGAEIVSFGGEPVLEAILNVEPFTPQSTEFGLRNEQLVFLTRGGIGEDVTVEFINPQFEEAEEETGFFARLIQAIRNFFGKGTDTKAEPKLISRKMTSIYELDSLFAVFQGGDRDEFALPAEYEVLPSGVGYIKINSNYDDLGLLIRVVERALEIFEDAEVLGLVIDMRLNYGGAPLGLAGFLHDEIIPLGQLEYFSDKTGQFEPDGPMDKVYPNENQYRFPQMILLVDQFCYSACEIEAYGFSQVPGMVVMGMFPTAGVEAETARGEFLLPEGMGFNIPTGRFTLPDGSIFLEGVGVQPTYRIQVTEESELSGVDTVLEGAVEYILGNFSG
jgi:C-terminal processing protease CtpA/Prc